MNFADMNPEDLVKAVAVLIETKRLTTEDVEDASRHLSQRIRNLVESVHAILCDDLHDAAHCNFYQEDQIDKGWEMPAHKAWLRITKRLQAEYSLTGDVFNDAVFNLNNIMGLYGKMKPEQVAFIYNLVMHKGDHFMSGTSFTSIHKLIDQELETDSSELV